MVGIGIAVYHLLKRREGIATDGQGSQGEFLQPCQREEVSLVFHNGEAFLGQLAADQFSPGGIHPFPEGV